MAAYAWIIPQHHSSTAVTMIYIFSAVSSIANVNYPAISAIKSMLTGPEEQGQVLGALAGVQSIGMGMGPLFFNVLFTWVRPAARLLVLLRLLEPPSCCARVLPAARGLPLLLSLLLSR